MYLILWLSACSPWGFEPDDYNYLGDPLWETDVSPVEGGVYVELPASGGLALVRSSGEVAAVDLDGARVEQVRAVPDGRSLLVNAAWDICADDDPKIERRSDCADDDQEIGYELDLVRDGEVQATLPVPPQFRSYVFNANGSIAAAFLDPATVGTVGVDGLLNPDAVIFIETVGAATHEVPVGFPPETVLFSEDGSKAVVLSRSQVAVVQLGEWSVSVTFPLTLDADQEVQPQDVVLAKDGRYALVSVAGQSDLYVLDLEQESIDLVELSGSPADMLVDTASDRTLLVYNNVSSFDMLEHDLFEIGSFDLDEPVNQIADGADFSLLYNAGSSTHDAYLFAPETGQLIEIPTENPIDSVSLNADRTVAVSLMGPDSGISSGAGGFYDQNYCLGIIHLVADSDPVTLVLEGPPVGVELVKQDGVDRALVLMQAVDKLLSVDLDAGRATAVELEVPPLAIGTMPDGSFVISHDSPLGMISFFDPSTGKIQTVAGFAPTGLLTDDLLPRREE